MLPINYLNLVYADVLKPADLFKDMGNNTETSKVRNLYNASKSIFGINSIKLSIVQESKIYRLLINSNKNKNFIVGSLIYFPIERRLDIWSSDNNQVPVIQYLGKRIVYKNYSEFYDKLGLDKLFNLLVSNL